MPALFDIRGLSVRFPGAANVAPAVDEVDLQIAARECVGLVGESGSGKTQLMLAATGLLPASVGVTGAAYFAGVDLLRAGERERDALRGRRIGYVFQDPLSSLTPHLTVGEQICEVLRVHLGLSRDAARQRALQLLERVRIGDPHRRFGQYPHQLSGGQRQRGLLAIALAAEPELLIADEPTTALDVTVQAELLELLRELKQSQSLAVVLITHDLGVAASLCDRIAVMYAGRIVEQAATAALLSAPRHPYSRLLLGAMPRLDAPADEPMTTVQGQPPAPHEARDPCAFAPRCPRVQPVCRRERPSLSGVAHAVACHFPHGDAHVA